MPTPFRGHTEQPIAGDRAAGDRPARDRAAQKAVQLRPGARQAPAQARDPVGSLFQSGPVQRAVADRGDQRRANREILVLAAVPAQAQQVGTRGHGQHRRPQTPAEAVQAALAGTDRASRADGVWGASGAEAFLGELAHRVAVGVASVCVVLDPGLVVLGGEVGRAGGTALADRVAAAVASIWPSRPHVVPTGIPGEPVLRGAMLAAVAQARAALLASVADPQ